MPAFGATYLLPATALAHADIPSPANTLPPVFITATRFADDANTLPFGVRVIRAEDIRRAGVSTVSEARMKLLGGPGWQDPLGGNIASLELRADATLATDGLALDAAANQRLADNHRDHFNAAQTASSGGACWVNDWLRAGSSHARHDGSTGLPGVPTAAEYDANPRQTTHKNDSAQLADRRDSVCARADLGDRELALDAGWRTKEPTSLNSRANGPTSAYNHNVGADPQALPAQVRFGSEALSNALA